MALTIRPDAEMIKELNIMKKSYQIAESNHKKQWKKV